MHRWYCPDCGRLLKRAPYRIDDDRYHAGRCRTPMLHATVIVHDSTTDQEDR